MSSTLKGHSGLSFSFELRFTRKQNEYLFPPGSLTYPSTFSTGEGRGDFSFPTNNSVNYEDNAYHFMLLSAASGRNINVRNTCLDVELDKDDGRIYSIKEDNKKTWFYHWS